jgi:hypothetical protein
VKQNSERWQTGKRELWGARGKEREQAGDENKRVKREKRRYLGQEERKVEAVLSKRKRGENLHIKAYLQGNHIYNLVRNSNNRAFRSISIFQCMRTRQKMRQNRGGRGLARRRCSFLLRIKLVTTACKGYYTDIMFVRLIWTNIISFYGSLIFLQSDFRVDQSDWGPLTS